MEEAFYNNFNYDTIENYSEHDIFSPDSEDSSSFTIASDTGSLTTITSATRFIVHTSTIPFINTFNVSLREAELMEHSILCKDCMLAPKMLMPISHKCPCLDIDEDIEEVCFLTFLRVLKNKTEDNMDIPEVQVDEFSFCKDSINILSHKYPRVLRDICNITGFHQISDVKTLVLILKTLYWYKFSKINMLEIFKIRNDLPFLLKSIKQAMYTVNGLLVKLFFIAGEFIYKELAIKTASLFDDILIDYLRRPYYTSPQSVAEVTEKQSIMLDLKKSHKYMKTYFNSSTYERRIEALNYKFNFKSLEEFLLPIYTGIEVNLNRYFLYEGRDYTETLAWKFEFSLLVQTRSLGYLPQRVAFWQDQKYRTLISVQRENPKPEITRCIELAVKDEFADANIPTGLLTLNQFFEPEYLEDSLKVLNTIDMPVKMAASYDTILQDGGKLEDCRQLISYAVKQNLKIPIRNLNDNKIVDYFYAKDTTSYSKIAFWLSYELAVEYLATYLAVKRQPSILSEYIKMTEKDLLFSKEKIRNFMNAKILHIQEPLKQRNLTKSTSELTWFLTPGSKMLQEMLSKLPEHTVGLKYSSDAWKFQQRIHPSGDGGFIFHQGNILPSAFVFSDWVEASDNIHKLIGYHHLKALMEYSGFPMAYRLMILTLIIIPQPVEEVLLNYSSEKILFRGFIRNGYMMGNPVTKSILHLLHVSELNLARKYNYDRYGVNYKRFMPNVQVVHKDIELINYLDHR
jgi:hypothetical protein